MSKAIMPDGNSFAERQHSASEARAEALHDAYGERVIQDIVDRLFTIGGKVDGLTLHDFLDEIGNNDIAPILLATGDARIGKLDTLKELVEEKIRDWCEGRGADYVDERVRSWAEDDKTRYREET